jgi:hypothetical protein
MNKRDLGLHAEGKTEEGHQDLGKNCASRLISKFYIDTNNECRSQIRFSQQFTHPVKIKCKGR